MKKNKFFTIFTIFSLGSSLFPCLLYGENQKSSSQKVSIPEEKSAQKKKEINKKALEDNVLDDSDPINDVDDIDDVVAYIKSSNNSLSKSSQDGIKAVSDLIRPEDNSENPTKVDLHRDKTKLYDSNLDLKEFNPKDNNKIKKLDKEKSSTIIESSMKNVSMSIVTNSEKFSLGKSLDDAYRSNKLGQTEVSRELYKKILEEDPDNNEAKFGLATIYHKEQMFGEAKALYAEILQDEPNNYAALNNFLAIIGEEAPAEAIMQLKKLESINRTIASIPAQIAMLYQKLGNNKQAITYLNKAVLLDDANVMYKYNLAIILDKEGEKDQAIKLYRAVLNEYNKGAILPDSAQKINERVIYLGSRR